MGGLAAAGLLARTGRSVILLERSPRVGGVCQALTREGFRFEIGATLLGGFGPGGSLSSLCERLGIRVPVKEWDPPVQVALSRHRVSLSAELDRWWPEFRREFPKDEAGWRALVSELEGLDTERERALQELPPLPPEGWGERLRVWRVCTMGALSGVPTQAGGALKRALGTPFRATVARHGLGQASQQVLDASLWYLLLRDADECSTLEAAVALHWVRRGVVAIPGGAATLADALVGQFQRDGGQLRLETEVTRCLLKGGRISGVETAGGERIRARWVVTDLPPGVLAGTLLPPRRGWFRRRRALDGPWDPTRIAQMMLLVLPEKLLPAELGGHCFVVRDPSQPARDKNLVFVRTAPAWDDGQAPVGLRCLTVGRFVAPGPLEGEVSVRADLLEAVDQIVPGVAGGLVYHEVLSPVALAEMWGRPSAAVRYATDPREWLGHRGLPHHTGWPGLLMVGDWAYPGRLISGVVQGAMRVTELITGGA